MENEKTRESKERQSERELSVAQKFSARRASKEKKQKNTPENEPRNVRYEKRQPSLFLASHILRLFSFLPGSV